MEWMGHFHNCYSQENGPNDARDIETANFGSEIATVVWSVQGELTLNGCQMSDGVRHPRLRRF